MTSKLLTNQALLQPQPAVSQQATPKKQQLSEYEALLVDALNRVYIFGRSPNA
jgi:hypothetical protein